MWYQRCQRHQPAYHCVSHRLAIELLVLFAFRILILFSSNSSLLVFCVLFSLPFSLTNKSAESWKWKSNKMLNDLFLQMTLGTTIALLVVVEFDEFLCIWFYGFVSCSLNGQVFSQQYKFRWFLLLFRFKHCVRCASIIFIFSQVLRFAISFVLHLMVWMLWCLSYRVA